MRAETEPAERWMRDIMVLGRFDVLEDGTGRRDSKLEGHVRKLNTSGCIVRKRVNRELSSKVG